MFLSLANAVFGTAEIIKSLDKHPRGQRCRPLNCVSPNALNGDFVSEFGGVRTGGCRPIFTGGRVDADIDAFHHVAIVYDVHVVGAVSIHLSREGGLCTVLLGLPRCGHHRRLNIRCKSIHGHRQFRPGDRIELEPIGVTHAEIKPMFASVDGGCIGLSVIAKDTFIPIGSAVGGV